MIWNIVVWILFGALAGWIASIIMGTDAEQGGVANVIVGIIGAFIGGAISRAFGGSGVTGFSISGLILSIIGAVVLLFFVGLFTGRGRTHRV
jgi:uncharacterized membrane protein YeaQ/YmgE (transglycosylase-associated protein family)